MYGERKRPFNVAFPFSQINHKYPERRLLVAESCGALAPYLPVSVCFTIKNYSPCDVNAEVRTSKAKYSVQYSFNFFTQLYILELNVRPT